MDPQKFQTLFFDRIAALSDGQLNVEVIGQILNINKSSVYNRLNGSQLLRLDELKALADHYRIPLQSMIPKSADQIGFSLPTMTAPILSSADYLERIHRMLSHFATAPDMRIWYSTSELPFFHYMNFRALALFKLFAWGRINWKLPYLEDSVFHPDTFQDAHVYEQYMLPILELYNQIPTVEFWTPGIFDNTLAQLHYFEESGQMAEGVADEIRAQMRALGKHQYIMAERGLKWAINQEPHAKSGAYELYLNTISPTNIAFFTESTQIQMVINVFDNPNIMFSTDPTLYTYTREWMTKLRHKCTQISLAAEQDRRKFFSKLQKQFE